MVYWKWLLNDKNYMATWDKIASRGKVEDRRSMAPVAGGIGLAGVALVVLFNVFTGGTTEDILNQVDQLTELQSQYQATQAGNTSASATGQYAGADDYEVFASTVLGSINDVWKQQFLLLGRTYKEPQLILFREGTSSACGTATSAVGPHYCPVDSNIYLDETFFDELTTRFGAQGGDVAEAYVLAHEAGHHVQNIFGRLAQTQKQSTDHPESANTLSVQQELQADCLAGIWANSLRNKNVFEPGEIREALDAASAVGDDRIQERVQGHVSPETWTHGSSEERVNWFTKGYESGDPKTCNTFVTPTF